MKDLERLHFIGGISPDADALAGTKNSDVFEVLGEGAFALVWLATDEGGANHRSTLTVQACDNTTPSNTSAVAFYYRSSTTFDTWGSWATASTAGITLSSADNMYEIYAPAGEFASAGYGYCRIHTVESSNSAVDAMVLCGVLNPHTQPPPSLID